MHRLSKQNTQEKIVAEIDHIIWQSNRQYNRLWRKKDKYPISFGWGV